MEKVFIMAAFTLAILSVYLLCQWTKRDEVRRVREASLLEGFRRGVLATTKVQELPAIPAMTVYRDLRHISLNL